MDLFEQVDFNAHVLLEDGEILTLRELSIQHADMTTTPRGVQTRMHIRDGRELWTWGPGGNSPSLVCIFDSDQEANHALLLCHKQDLDTSDISYTGLKDREFSIKEARKLLKNIGYNLTTKANPSNPDLKSLYFSGNGIDKPFPLGSVMDVKFYNQHERTIAILNRTNNKS